MLIPETRPPRWVGLATAAVAVAAITALIYPIRQVARLSRPVCCTCGSPSCLDRLGAFGSDGHRRRQHSRLQFLPHPADRPIHGCGRRDWVALGVFLFAALLTSTVAEVARTRATEAELRRREADLAAEMARVLLSGSSVALGPAGGGPLARAGARSAFRGHRARCGRTRSPARCCSARGQRRPRGHGPAASRHSARDPGARSLAHRPRDPGAVGRGSRSRGSPGRGRRNPGVAGERRDQDGSLRAVSHDLRSPLTTIVAAAEALQSPTLDPDEGRELAQAVSADANRLSHLVEQLLDLSRLRPAQPSRDATGLRWRRSSAPWWTRWTPTTCAWPSTPICR